MPGPVPANLNVILESAALGVKFTRTFGTANFAGMSAGLHRGRRHTNTGHVRAQGMDTLRRCHQRQWNKASLHRGPPTPTRATSGREDWIPLSQMPHSLDANKDLYQEAYSRVAQNCLPGSLSYDQVFLSTKGLSRALINVQEVPWERHNSARYFGRGPGRA